MNNDTEWLIHIGVLNITAKQINKKPHNQIYYYYATKKNSFENKQICPVSQASKYKAEIFSIKYSNNSLKFTVLYELDQWFL